MIKKKLMYYFYHTSIKKQFDLSGCYNDQLIAKLKYLYHKLLILYLKY